MQKQTFSAKALGNEYATGVSRPAALTTKAFLPHQRVTTEGKAMEIKDLLKEIEVLESNIRSTDNLLEVNELHGLSLIIVAANNTQYRGVADQEFLIEALKSKRNEMHERLVKLVDAAGVVEKVIDGLVA
ncbi:hypothetical protein ABK774_20180 [Enterobacter hormaechei]|uniref:hypothetical protein n=1 Tax=Enterobacter hormaechei TaxID=158836 RepID=UPI0037504AAF